MSLALTQQRFMLPVLDDGLCGQILPDYTHNKRSSHKARHVLLYVFILVLALTFNKLLFDIFYGVLLIGILSDSRFYRPS